MVSDNRVSAMDKTVIVVAANSLSSASCGQTIALDLSIGKAKSASTTKNISKSLWSCSVEAVTEYCRIVFDLFPDQYQMCVAAVDELKCQPINSWRDEDQDVVKILTGFQKFGPPHFQSQSGPGHTHLSPCLQGMQYAVRCLAQLTATQYAKTVCPGMKTPINQGRIIFVSTLKSSADVRELEKNMISMVRTENADIKQKQDTARLPVHFCQLVIVNTHAPTAYSSDIKDAPLTQLSSQVSSVAYSFPAKLLLDKCVSLAKLHFNLKSTIITGIPMKEEQAGGSSANYDVELIHLAEAHRDIMRAGYSLGPPPISKKDTKDTHSRDSVMLKWSTPKTTSLELQYCTSAYRVTPAIVTSRPTICLINFVLSGKPVLLEQMRKGAVKVISHVLTSHSGAVFIHCIPSSKSYLDDLPSISEGWGGRITDYRISDFSQVVQENLLFPIPVDRTKIPSVFPIQKAMAKLERETRHWPLVYNDTIVYTLSQDLDPLPHVIRKDSMTDSELEECKGVIQSLQAKESANEPLPIPSTGGRTKGVKRDEQYRSLWTELENLAEAFSGNSDKHRQLFELILQASSLSPSMQMARKTPPNKSESSTPYQTPATTPTAAKEDLAWQELERYQQMTEREKKDYNLGDRNNEHGLWKQKTNSGSLQSQQQQQQQHPLPIPAKPVASILSIWTARQRNKANSSHTEFAGRLNYGARAELYPSLNNSSVVPPVEQDS